MVDDSCTSLRLSGLRASRWRLRLADDERASMRPLRTSGLREPLPPDTRPPHSADSCLATAGEADRRDPRRGPRLALPWLASRAAPGPTRRAGGRPSRAARPRGRAAARATGRALSELQRAQGVEPTAALDPALSRTLTWAPTRDTHMALTWAPGGPRKHSRARPSFPNHAVSAKLGRMSRREVAEVRWAIVMANGMRPADIEAWWEALIGPDRCQRCNVELPPMPGPGRPRVWCDEHHPRRPAPAGRVCVGCGASLDGRRRQTVVCSERCRSRIRRRTHRA
jgi:hypothetical protein